MVAPCWYALIPLLPLLAFIVLGLAGHVLRDRAHLIAVPAVGLSFLLSVLAFSEVAGGRVLEIPLYTWGASGDLTIRLGLYVDQLTAAMLLLVTIVSGLVHVYTIGYMHGEPGLREVFRQHRAVHVFDADAGHVRQLPPTVRVLGSGGPVLLFADRSLV